MEKQKVLTINGPLPDLRDVLRIAVVEGRKALKTKEVKINPFVYPIENSYLVVVRRCDGASDVGSGKTKRT